MLGRLVRPAAEGRLATTQQCQARLEPSAHVLDEAAARAEILFQHIRGEDDLDAGLPPILSSVSRGVLTVAPIFHSFSTFNPNDAVQVLSGASPGGRDLRIGFEDLPTATGDNDFQDVLISIRTNADGLFIL